MPTTPTRTVQAVVIDRTDGQQTKFTAKDRIVDRSGAVIPLEQVPTALVDAAGWIDYATEAQWRSDREPEPWEPVEEEPYYVAAARVYARAVVEVMLVYDERAPQDD